MESVATNAATYMATPLKLQRTAHRAETDAASSSQLMVGVILMQTGAAQTRTQDFCHEVKMTLNLEDVMGEVSGPSRCTF